MTYAISKTRGRSFGFLHFLEGTLQRIIMFFHVVFARGSIHEGDSRFIDISRGRQCAFMSLSALLWANSSDILTWKSQTIDEILIEGDAIYLKAFEDRSIPDEGTISLDYFPDQVLFPTIRTVVATNAKHN